MSNDTTNSTFSATSARAAIYGRVCDMAIELEDYDGYVCDAISEIADSSVSIYTADNIAFCREHSDDVKEALLNGLALDGSQYFDSHPGHDYEDYEAHLGAVAEYVSNERALYEDLEDGIEYAVLGAIAKHYGDELDKAAYEYVKDAKCCDWDDNNERIDSIKDEAVDLYKIALVDAAVERAVSAIWNGAGYYAVKFTDGRSIWTDGAPVHCMNRDALMDELRDAYDEEVDGHTPYIVAVNDDE